MTCYCVSNPYYCSKNFMNKKKTILNTNIFLTDKKYG